MFARVSRAASAVGGIGSLSAVYLIRHGQAGPRNDYDRLSDLGQRQAELLGAKLVAQRIRVDQACEFVIGFHSVANPTFAFFLGL